MVTDRFTWIYKCDTVHVIVAWGGVYREKLDIDSAVATNAVGELLHEPWRTVEGTAGARSPTIL